MNVLEYFAERFGIEKAAFDGYGLYMGSRGRVYLGPEKLTEKPSIIAPGMLVARIAGAIKPSTNFIQMFGHLAVKNVISLSREQAARFAKGDDLECEEGSDGYVILSYAGQPLGCGMLKGKNLKNLLPKSRRQELKYL
jgi:hypothetical protein